MFNLVKSTVSCGYPSLVKECGGLCGDLMQAGRAGSRSAGAWSDWWPPAARRPAGNRGGGGRAFAPPLSPRMRWAFRNLLQKETYQAEEIRKIVGNPWRT